MTVKELIRELQELAATYGDHVEIVVPCPYRDGDTEMKAEEAIYVQAKIHVR